MWRGQQFEPANVGIAILVAGVIPSVHDSERVGRKLLRVRPGVEDIASAGICEAQDLPLARNRDSCA